MTDHTQITANSEFYNPLTMWDKTPL